MKFLEQWPQSPDHASSLTGFSICQRFTGKKEILGVSHSSITVGLCTGITNDNEQQCDCKLQSEYHTSRLRNNSHQSEDIASFILGRIIFVEMMPGKKTLLLFLGTVKIRLPACPQIYLHIRLMIDSILWDGVLSPTPEPTIPDDENKEYPLPSTIPGDKFELVSEVDVLTVAKDSNKRANEKMANLQRFDTEANNTINTFKNPL
jgi:hypothetical protein